MGIKKVIAIVGLVSIVGLSGYSAVEVTACNSLQKTESDNTMEALKSKTEKNLLEVMERVTSEQLSKPKPLSKMFRGGRVPSNLDSLD